MARASSHEQGLAPQGHDEVAMRWEVSSFATRASSHSQRDYMYSGTRRQERPHTSRNLHHRDTMKLRREELFRAASGPPGMLEQNLGIWECHGMPGAAGSGEARSWRGDLTGQEQGQYWIIGGVDGLRERRETVEGTQSGQEETRREKMK